MRLTLASVSMIAAFLASATASEAADYTIDPTHSHVLFTIDHLGFAKMRAGPGNLDRGIGGVSA
jgi:polyisoprenoid-binding protein YceI